MSDAEETRKSGLGFGTLAGRRGGPAATIRFDMDTISVEGPVEMVDGALLLRIPMGAGGEGLAGFAGRIGRIEGDCLCVTIPAWLAEKLRVGEGSLVVVDNRGGKFTITRSARNDPDPGSATGAR